MPLSPVDLGSGTSVEQLPVGCPSAPIDLVKGVWVVGSEETFLLLAGQDGHVFAPLADVTPFNTVVETLVPERFHHLDQVTSLHAEGARTVFHAQGCMGKTGNMKTMDSHLACS